MPKTLFICQWCNKEFSQYFCKTAKPNAFKFCSNKCKYDYLKRFRIKYNCSICGKSCEKQQSEELKKTCGSKECRNKQNSISKTGKKLPPRSQSFREKVRKNMTGRKGANHPGWRGGGFTKKICEFCHKEYLIKGSNEYLATRRFCNKECRSGWIRSVSKRPEYLRKMNRIHHKLHGKQFEKIAKEIRKRDNYTCQICGVYQTKPSLHVHHIVKVRKLAKQSTDPEHLHQPSNLISLCGPCHMKVERKIIPCPLPK